MDKEFKTGLFYGLGAYVLWGVLPIYWKLLGNVQAFEVLCNRFVWSAVFVWLLIYYTGKRDQFKQETRLIFSSAKSAIAMVSAAIMIAFNWGIFIWAVADGRILETSMGYYINPLVSVLFGVVLLKEPLPGLQKAAVALATLGVSYYIWQMGYLPWVSLGLALTFATYGYLKKLLPIAALTSIQLETLIIMPIVLMYLYHVHLQGGTAYETQSLGTITLLVLAGAVTAIPLLLFTGAAKILPLKLIGFLQYFAPSISMMIGIFMYGEQFTTTHLVAFSFIWLGLGLFTISQLRSR